MPFSQSEPTASGGVYVGIRDWVYKVHGPDGHARVREALPNVDREALDNSSIVNTSRVPASTFKNLGDAIIGLWGVEGERGYLSAAEHVAMSDLSSYMKILMKLGTPSFVLQRFPRVWKHYFTTGALTVHSSEPVDAEVEIAGGGPYGDAALLGAVGWMRAALIYSGAKRVSVQYRADGTRSYRYKMRWE